MTENTPIKGKGKIRRIQKKMRDPRIFGSQENAIADTIGCNPDAMTNVAWPGRASTAKSIDSTY
jgi:hypothetical protein